MRAILKYYCAMVAGLLCIALISGCHPRAVHVLHAVHDTFMLRQTVHDTTLHTLPAELVEVFLRDTLHHRDTIVRENGRIRIERILLPGGIEVVKVDCKADSLHALLVETQNRLAIHESSATIQRPAEAGCDACHPFRTIAWSVGITAIFALIARPLVKLALGRIPFFRA